MASSKMTQGGFVSSVLFSKGSAIPKAASSQPEYAGYHLDNNPFIEVANIQVFSSREHATLRIWPPSSENSTIYAS
ncbi:hypothetical protein BDN72DRAFT_851506 [Pluteus cervinus]|uniref:Uncharacterized protein n=1 Tax=Pluteus cervinus TaxID=181527 RepID=A0ACD3A0S9_9AGAR|nr:hypothetical protein BDN72DRAFT_851506 [Pluteus cervinus]